MTHALVLVTTFRKLKVAWRAYVTAEMVSQRGSNAARFAN
jgi:hypothetical protein